MWGNGGGGGARFRDDEHARLIGAANLLRFLSKKLYEFDTYYVMHSGYTKPSKYYF